MMFKPFTVKFKPFYKGDFHGNQLCDVEKVRDGENSIFVDYQNETWQIIFQDYVLDFLFKPGLDLLSVVFLLPVLENT